MNKNLFIVVSIICFTACSKANQKTTLQYEGLKGKVKSTFSYCYEAKSRFGKIEKGDIARTSILPEWSNLYPAYQREYNSDGNLMKISTYFKNGETDEVTTYEYIGDKIASICTYDDEGNIWYTAKYSYNRGKLVDYETSQSYDKHHGIIHRYAIVNGEIVADSSYIKGELSSITFYNNDNMFTYISTTIDNEGKEIDKVINTKDKSGRTIELEFVTSERSSFVGYSMQYTYNKIGWITSITREEERSCSIPDACTSATTNQMQTYEKVSSNTEKITSKLVFDYQEYDKIGNWISRVIYIDGELKALEERTIEYY